MYENHDSTDNQGILSLVIIDDIYPSTEDEVTIQQESLPQDIDQIAVIEEQKIDLGKHLIRAIYSRCDLEEASALIKLLGNEVNYIHEYGNTALIMAAETGNVAVMELLIAVPGIDINCTTSSGCTSLIMASRVGRAKIVELLIAVQGIDVNHVDGYGYTALMYSAMNGHIDVVGVLIAGGAEVDIKSQGRGQSALIMATENGHTKIVDLLIDRGSDVNLVDKNGLSALMHAAARGLTDVLKVLIRYSDIDIVDDDGDTALMYAVVNESYEVLDILIDAGADVRGCFVVNDECQSEVKTELLRYNPDKIRAILMGAGIPLLK